MSKAGARSPLARIITPKLLAGSWAKVRQHCRAFSYRDVIDYLEYDVDPNTWIRRLVSQLDSGTYRPARPSIATLAKGRGFRRRISYPAIEDLVLYRACADYFRHRARKDEHAHAYFEQSRLSKVRNQFDLDAQQSASSTGTLWDSIREWLTDYESASSKRYRAWLRYSQYRKWLIFKRVYKYIVVTDISNFFDSVLHTHLVDMLTQYSRSADLVRLVELLIESFYVHPKVRPPDPIGIPVDEADASRAFAHLLLNAHDKRLLATVSSESYVRWMDDQNFGANSKSEALRVVQAVQDSLSQLHLIANTSKTRILTTHEAKRYFHFGTNERLDSLEKLPAGTARERKHLRELLLPVWAEAQRDAGHGHWEKVLKRFYLRFAAAGSRRLRARAFNDMVEYPTLGVRILQYLLCTGTPQEYLNSLEKMAGRDDLPYDDLPQAAVETALRLEPDSEAAKSLRTFASDLLSDAHPWSALPHVKAVAPLLLLRFADRRSFPTLLRVVTTESTRANPALLRSAAVIYATDSSSRLREIRDIASQHARNPMATIVMMVERTASLRELPDHFRERFQLRFDPLRRVSYVDMRTLTVARLLLLKGKKPVKEWIAAQTLKWHPRLSPYDRSLVARLLSIR